MHAKLFFEMMAQFGIENVRGGPYGAIDLPNWQLRAIEFQISQIRQRKVRCFRCGQKGHYVKDCPKRKKDDQKKEE